MADIVADIASIQDEDQLRHMWSNTEDFAKKKEIRVRLYKLRESRLKLNYSNEDNTNVSSYNRSSSNLIQDTNRKHTATKTFDTIQDQGYMSLKSKEIRDSESPTRDIHGKIIRNDSYNNKSYDIRLMDNTVVLPNSQDWTTSQKSNYSTNVDGNTVTESAERQSSAVLAKDNENITLNSQEKQAFSTTDNSKDGNIDKSTTLQESADLVQNSSYQDDNTSFQAVSKQKQEASATSSVKQIGNVTSYTTSSRTVSSKASSSKTVTSSSKIISSKGLAIESGDDFVDKTLSIKQNEIDDEVQSNLNYNTRKTSKVDRTVRKRSSTASLSDAIQKRNSLTSSQIHDVNESDYNADVSDTTDIRSSRIVENRTDSSSSIQSSKIIKNQSDNSSKVETLKTIQDATDADEYVKRQNLKNSDINVSKSEVIKSDQTYNKSSYDNSRKLTENEKITDSTRIDTVEGDTSPTKHKSDVSDVKMYNSRKDIKTSHLTNVNTTSTTENKNVDQNIMTELSNLDSYLSTHPTSTPASPRSAVTDIDYQDARRAPVKHPSTLDLPKECTEGQYVTTYNDSYKNRISTNYDVSPTHNAFASSLRADTPERSPSSPTRAFSTDRKSPRSSPEKYNTRSVSENRYRKSPEKTPTRDSPNRFSKESPERKSVRSSPDRYQSRKSPERTPTRELPSRKSPERTPNRSSPNMTRLSPTKSPVDSKFSKQPITTSPTRKSPERSYNKLDNATETTRKAQDRRMSSSSYTIETKKDTNKSKRKFSSAQSKDAAKKRISTPKVSPDTSPTRDGNTSDSSNNSQGTYNTSTRKTQDVTRIDSQDTYGVTQNTYTGTTEYTRSDSHDTYNKYRRDSTDTYNKDETDRNESRNSYTIGTEEDTHEFERSDSTDSFNVKKLRKDSKDITKQELKQRKLFSESENQNVKTTRTNDFIKTEISENAQQNSYTSPSVSPVRQKSPEYSSEGSITKEIKLVNSLTDKNLTLIEQAEEINTETSASVTPCTSPDSYQTAPRRPSILKKKATDSQMNQESKTQTFAFESQKTPQQSPVRTSPTSPAKSFIDDEAVKNKTERKSSILKSTSKFENKEEIYDTKTAERKSSILKSPVKEKSPERNLEKGHATKDEYKITVTEQSRKSPTHESSTRARKSPSPTKSPRESPTRSTLSIESRLTSPTQASLIREQKISESFDFTVKERRSPTKSPLREDAPRQPSPQKSTVRDTKSPEKTRRTPVREKASPQRVPSKPVEKRPTRKSSIPRAESLKSINKKPALTPSRQQTPKVAPTTPKVSPVTPKTTAPTPKVTPSKTPSQRSLTPQQSKSSIKTTPQKFPVTSRTNSANISKTSTLVKTNSYSSRRATEPVKQAKPVTPAVQTKIPTKAPVKQAPQVVSKQPSTKKLPVKSPKGTKELKTNVTKKQNKTTINIEEEIRASNKTLEDILNKEQQAYYDSEIDSEVPPEEFLVEDDDDFCELTGSTRTESKSFFSSKQDQIRKEKVEQQDSSSDEENENIRITKAKRVDEKLTNTQNEDLLSVVVQLPNSSRESTPGVKNTGAQQVPYTSDINQPARYADYYSEPETDNEKTIKSVETSQYEQVTDLDEEAIDLNVSVADRVNKFLNSTRSEVDKENNQSVIEKKSVSQAKNLFENIAKSQSSPNYNENITKTHVETLSSRQPVSEDVCETKNYYEVNHTEKRTTNDFINVEKDSISHDELVKKSPKDIYLEKTNHSSTTPQKPGKVAQPHKKLFDDTYYIEKNKRKQEDIEKTTLNKTTIDSCDEYIEINEQYDVKKKSPKDIYLEKTQKSSSKTNVEIQKKPTDVVEEKKPEVKTFKRVPSTTLNNTKSKKNFFEEKINIEAEKSKSTLKTNKSTDKVFKSDKRSPVRQSPTRKSPEYNEPKTKSPARQSPTRKSPEKVKRKYDTRKDSLMEIRASNIIAERRTKFSPLKENQTEPVGRRVTKSVSSKENIKPNEKKSDRRSAERKSQEKTTTTTSKTISNDIPQDKFTKERKPSVERVQRKSSSKFEERRASFEKKTVTERKVSSEIKQSERRISSDRTATESRKSKSKSPEPKANKDRSSPARKVSSKTSLDFEAKPAQKIDSFNNKFGVALKKTSNTSSTNVTTKSNTNNVLKASNKNTATTTDSIFDIESIFDLELLEKMLEKAVGYDQRRRLRTQIREVKKVQDETINKKSTSPSRNTNQKKSFIDEKQQKEFQSSTISSAAKTFQQSSPTQYGPTPAKKSSTGYEPTRPVDKAAPSQEKRNSYTRNDTTETSVVQRKGSSEYSQTSTYTTSQVREETCTDSITSSYGVGPTDENGRPLFGLKALRRTNTNKALVDDDFTNSSSVQITEEETEEFGGLKDSSGRPLFGGLRALKLADMPEQPPTSQLKDLVQKHEKSARDAAAVPLLRTDKPKAKFRRSFILDEEKIEAARPEDGRSPSAPVSLKSLWLNGQEVKLGGKSERGQEDEDTTVVSSRTSMKTDSSGKVTVTRDTMAGEISVKDNEEPKGKLIKAEYKFNKTSADDKGVSEAKTTTAILNGKNIKDSQITESLKLTDHNRTNNFIENEKKSSFRKTDSSSSFKENQESGTEKRKKSDSNATFVSKRNAENEKRFSKTDSSSSFSSKQVVESSSTEKRSNYRKTDSSSSVTRQDGEDDVEVEVRRKPVVRGDSVRALQNKFQQATVSSSMKSATPALSNESKAVTSSNQSSKTVTSNGTTSTTTTKSSSTRTETFSTVTKGSSSYADSEEEDGSDRQRGNMIEDDGIGNSSAALVSRIEKQRVASTTSETRSDSRQKLDLSDVDLISDESQLRILLDACSDYEGRRKIRARLRDVMAENNDSSAMATQGVYLGADSDEDDVKLVNDSGTESSEDQTENSRIVDEHIANEPQDKELMTEVQITLARLENELKKSSNKDNVQGLMSKLKSFLNVKNTENNQELGQTIPTPPPRKYHKHRHSVAGSQNFSEHSNNQEDIIRHTANQHRHENSPVVTVNIGKNTQPKILVTNGNRRNDVQSSNLNNSINKNKNIVHFQKDILDNNRTNNNAGRQNTSRQSSLDIPNYKNQLHKQSSLDSDYSLASPKFDQRNEMAQVESINPDQKTYDNVHYSTDVHALESSEPDKPLVATLTIRENNRTDDADDGDISSDDDEVGGNIRNARKLMKFAKNEMKSKQLVRSSKKIKMKRSNTIDIPKNMKYYSSGDELAGDDRMKTKTPTFIPKTENDFKFLAFLKKNNSEETKTYNSAARGGTHWSNRFSCIKTTFENAEKDNMNTIVEPKKSKAKLFWQKSEEKMNRNNNKVPWMSSESDQHNVVTGSLVVQTKPNQSFTHDMKSPFQAINKVQNIPQTKTSFSGTVKQMANEKFNNIENVHNLEPKASIGITVRKSDKPNTFSSNSTTAHHNFGPDHTNFKPIPQRSDAANSYKPIVQPVYPYQKPQMANHPHNQTQIIKKQFPEPQYVPKVLSPQYRINAFKDNTMYESPQDHDRSRIFSPSQERIQSVFNDTPNNFQVQNNSHTGYYENQISPYEPSVVEIHKSPLCTKNGSHFTPISPAVVDSISYEPQTVAVSRVMGREQCQQAVIVNNSNKQHFNESTNVLKNILSQHQNYENQESVTKENESVDDSSTNYHLINTTDLPSNTSYVYPNPVNHTKVTVQPLNYTSNSSVPRTFQNYPQSTNDSSYQNFISPPSNSNYHQSSPAMVQQQYYPPVGQAYYQSDSNRIISQGDGRMYKSSSIPQNNYHQISNNPLKTRPNSMYIHSDDFSTNVNFSNNPVYSSKSAPYALSGSKSSSAVYPASIMSPVNYPYRNNSSIVSLQRNYPSIPSDQFADSRQRQVSNNVTSYERAISQPPTPKNNSAIINNAPMITSRSNFKPTGGESKISYMNYISQISPQTMQSKLNYSPGRKSISPSCPNSQSYGELSQSSTQSSISDNSPINKLVSPHMNLSSPQFPAPPILTKTPQLKISSKTAFVPVKPFIQTVGSSSTPKQNLKLPPSSPNASYNISPSTGFVSPMSPSSSPKMPSVLQKSESWHQMVLDRMAPKKLSPIPSGPGKLQPKAKSSHSLNFAKQFEAAIPDTIEKKKTVEAYLNTDIKKEINKYNFKQFKKTKTSKSSSSSSSKAVVPLSDNLDNVDEAFDSLFHDSK